MKKCNLKNLIVPLLMLMGFFMYYLILCKGPYFGDDIYNSCIRGNLNEYHQSIWKYMCDAMGGWFFQGRVFPIAVFQYLVFYLMPGLRVYKLYLIAFSLIEIGLFGLVCYKATHDISAANLAMVILGLLMPVYAYDGVNALEMFGGLTHMVMLCGLLAMLFQIQYFEKGGWIWNVLAAFFAACAMLTYEPGYAIPIILFGIICCYRREIRKILLDIIPLFCFCGSVCLVTILAKIFSKSQAYEGIVLSLDGEKIVETFGIQFLGAIPFKNWSKAPKPVYIWGDWKECYQNLDFIVIAAVCVLIVALILNNVFRDNKEVPLPQKWMIFIAGCTLWITPAFLISLSAKYQRELVETHLPYLPVFLEIFGLAFLLFFIATWGKYGKIFLNILCLVMIVTVIPIFHYSVDLRNQASELNYRTPRETLIEAINIGMFDDVDEDAVIALDNRYTPLVSCNLISTYIPSLKTNYYYYKDMDWTHEYELNGKNEELDVSDQHHYLVKGFISGDIKIVLSGRVKKIIFNTESDSIKDIKVDQLKVYVNNSNNLPLNYALTFFDSEGMMAGMNLGDYVDDAIEKTINNNVKTYLFRFYDYEFSYFNTLF